MKCPFPGMDPWLEHPALSPDVHNSFIAAIRDAIAPRVRPHYNVAIERRVYLLASDELLFIGRPDALVISSKRTEAPAAAEPKRSGATALEVEVPMLEEVGESFLEVRHTETAQVVTVLELLSPANKIHARGRREYEEKRAAIFSSRTSFVEIDLLRAGEPMPLSSPAVTSAYRILVSPGWTRPRACLMALDVRDPLPKISLPLDRSEDAPELELGPTLHDLYERAGYDLRLDYSRPPVPPLRVDDEDWAREMVRAAQA